LVVPASFAKSINPLLNHRVCSRRSSSDFIGFHPFRRGCGDILVTVDPFPSFHLPTVTHLPFPTTHRRDRPCQEDTSRPGLLPRSSSTLGAGNSLAAPLSLSSNSSRNRRIASSRLRHAWGVPGAFLGPWRRAGRPEPVPGSSPVPVHQDVQQEPRHGVALAGVDVLCNG